MSIPSNISIAELDFDQILTNLINFIKNDPAFTDYDFAGSGLRLLARVLAYTIFYQNYYLTAAVNEGFLDTAQLRSSVASLARMLGYEIKGTQGAHYFANVSISLSDSSVMSITLPKYTPFITVANSSITFYSLNDSTLTQNADTLLYQGSNIELIEGRPLTYRFTVDLTNPTQRFIIPNANVDYSSVDVKVQTSNTNNTVTQFIPAADLLTIGPQDPVFFVQEAYNQLPEIKFGNGVIGVGLQQGNIVIVTYFISHGADGNNVRGPFTIPTANITGFVSGTTAVDGNTVPSLGGADTQSIDDARFLAPLVYQTQNRCVTADDYKAVILSQFGDQIGAINVFGGEQGDPNDPLNRPAFGRVFIVLKPQIGQQFTDIVRSTIEQNILKPRSIIGVIPEVIDPDYTYLNILSSVRFDPKATTLTKTALVAAISNSIITFTQQNIEKFDTSFRFSRFVRVIDDTDDSIVSSLTRIDLEKRIFPNLNASNHYVLKYNAPLRVRTGSVILESTNHRFSYRDTSGVVQDNCFLYDALGVVSVSKRDTNGNLLLISQNIGTVNTDIGLITLSNFSPTAIENGDIDVRIRVVPAVNDFVPILNQLFTIDTTTGVTIQLLNDATATIADQQFFFGGILP